MKISVVKELVETFTTEELTSAEDAIIQEIRPKILIPGEDEGEQLTHILASLWVLDDMKRNNTDFRTSIRSYSQKVRKSID